MARPREGSTAPDILVHDAAGGNLRLSDLWREHILVLVFLRHLG
jgi:hypothetical protein